MRITIIIILAVLYNSCALNKKKMNTAHLYHYVSVFPVFEEDKSVYFSPDTTKLFEKDGFFLYGIEIRNYNNDTDIQKIFYDFVLKPKTDPYCYYFGYTKNDSFTKIHFDSIVKKMNYFKKRATIVEDDKLLYSVNIQDTLKQVYINEKAATDLSYSDTTFLYFKKESEATLFTLDSVLEKNNGFKFVKVKHQYKVDRFIKEGLKEGFEIKYELIKMGEKESEEMNSKLEKFKKLANLY